MMYQSELYHHGILGQRWGIRRFQNEDGTLTEAGKKKIQSLEKKNTKLEGKLSKIHMKSAKKNQKAAKVEAKGLKKMAKATNRDKYEDAVQTQIKANKMKMKAAKYDKKAASIEAKILKHNKFVKELTKPLTEVKQETIDAGKDFVQGQLEETNKE